MQMTLKVPEWYCCEKCALPRFSKTSYGRKDVRDTFTNGMYLLGKSTKRDGNTNRGQII